MKRAPRPAKARTYPAVWGDPARLFRTVHVASSAAMEDIGSGRARSLGLTWDHCITAAEMGDPSPFLASLEQIFLRYSNIDKPSLKRLLVLLNRRLAHQPPDARLQKKGITSGVAASVRRAYKLLRITAPSSSDQLRREFIAEAVLANGVEATPEQIRDFVSPRDKVWRKSARSAKT